MTMDLIPRHRNLDKDLSYNWEGWCTLIDFLQRHGGKTEEFSGTNDGELICANTCRQVAKIIEENSAEYNSIYGGGSYGKLPAQQHAKIWHDSHGFRQH